MSLDTDLGEDERLHGFPEHLSLPALELVKAEGLRQAADLLLDDSAFGPEHSVDVDGCAHCAVALWLEERAGELDTRAHALLLAGDDTDVVDLDLARYQRRGETALS